MNQDLRIYKERLSHLNDQRSPQLFSNGKLEHAAAILEAFFTHATERVVIFCQNLHSEAYDESSVFASLQAALQRGIRVDIISQEEPQSHDLVLLSKTAKEQGLPLTLRVCGESDPVISSMKVNFAVMDGRAFRFEQDRSQPTAVASMNRPDFAAKLLDSFNGLFLKLAA